jgi:ABC-type dipeptide/oligopeptide/nickel transport system ATPase component
MSGESLLSVRNLRTWFDEDGRIVRAVDDVSFDVRPGETLGIVGESGSGKSVTNLSIMRLVPSPPGRIVSGEILLEGEDLLRLTPEAMRALRGKRMAMIFQDPMTSLNPFMRISRQLMEVTELHLGHSRTQAREHAFHLARPFVGRARKHDRRVSVGFEVGQHLRRSARRHECRQVCAVLLHPDRHDARAVGRQAGVARPDLDADAFLEESRQFPVNHELRVRMLCLGFF